MTKRRGGAVDEGGTAVWRYGGRDVPDTPTALPPYRPTALLPAFRHRNFRLFYGGFVVSLVGVWMHRVAQSWLVLELTDSAFWVGAIDALSALPVLLFTLYAGVLADRVARQRMVLVTQAGAMVFALLLAALVLLDRVALWHVVTIAILLGATQAFDIPVRHALMTDLVGKEDLTNAIALNSAAFNATRVVGPAVAGVVIGAVGLGACFLANGVSYLGVLAALLLLRLPPYRQTAVPPESTWQRMRAGLVYVVSDARSRTMVLNIAFFSIFGVPAFVLMPVMARDVLGRGADAYGWMMSAVGVGALTGALGVAVLGHRLPRGRILSWAATAFGALVVAFALSRSLPLTLGILAVLGFAMIMMTALTNTLLQTIAPDELRGRVVSFYAWAFVGLSPFGAFQAGTVAEWVGTPIALAAGGTVVFAAAVVLLVRSREVGETK